MKRVKYNSSLLFINACGPLLDVLKFLDFKQIFKSTFLVNKTFKHACEISLKGRNVKISEEEIAKFIGRNKYVPLLNYKVIDPGLGYCNYAIIAGCLFGDYNLVELLLKDERVDPSAIGNHALHLASQNGHFKVVGLLLKDRRLDLSADDNHAIKLASRYGHFKVVELLLKDRRVDPSANNNDAIRKASNSGHNNVVKLLLKDNRVKELASRQCNIAIIEILLKERGVKFH